MREETAFTVNGQQKIILCSDVLIIHTNKNVRNGIVNVFVHPLSYGMKTIQNSSDDACVSIISEFGWVLHEFQLLKSSSCANWLTAFKKSQNFLKLRKDSLSNVCSCPISVLKDTLEKAKIDFNLEYLDVSKMIGAQKKKM